jgi:hypothetical protein
MLMGAKKMQRIAWVLIFIEQYHKDDNELLSHIIQVTGDDTWVSFVNDETNEK